MDIDRRRRFELPSIQDLNKDQDKILALPLEGQHLIIGGPGTGKSVMALLRARQLSQKFNRKDYRFLAYNHLLYQSSRLLFGENSDLNSYTLMSWFGKVWYSAFKQFLPKPTQSEAWVDWERIANNINNLPNLSERWSLPFLVIDEGQDMPPAFYNALINFGFENFFIVADQNQQIADECSSRQDLENALGIEKSETYVLNQNYRNTYPIAALARCFYTGDQASPPPDLPEKRASALTPELWNFGPGTDLPMEELAVRILQMADRDPRKLIGVIAPNNTIREKYFFALNQATPQLDNGRPPIQTYKSGKEITFDFSNGGIVVINAQSCKGLEFETVILADIDAHQSNNKETLSKLFYVMVTRAREQTILLRTGAVNPILEELLPNDVTVLDRKNSAVSTPVVPDGFDNDIPF